MPFRFKRLLEDIAGEKAPGPASSFSVFHILRAIEIIGEKPIGRGKLAADLNVGGGAVRTMINRLEAAGLITISKAGCCLTKKGLNLWKEYHASIKKFEIGKSRLTDASHNFAVLIKGQGHKLKSGIEQRDAAVRVGAKSATTIVFRRGQLIIPSVSDNVAKDFPEAANQITEILKPEAGDVIIIVGADSFEQAEYGVLAATWTLLNDTETV